MRLCRLQVAEWRRFLVNSLSNRRYQRRRVGKGQVSVLYYEVGNTLTVWFGNPEEEYVAEETGEEVILIKDRAGKVIGFEKLSFSIAKPKYLKVAFETVAALRRRLFQDEGATSRSECGPTRACSGLASPRRCEDWLASR
jgi:hypothetical protein